MSLIPIHEGPVRVPEYSLQWFNTNTQEFEYAKLPPMTLQVRPGSFAMESPDVNKQLDQVSNDLQVKNTVVDKTNQENNDIAVETSIPAPIKTSYLWQIISASFAVLWIITLILYFKKPKKIVQQSQKNEIPLVSKKNIIAAINAKNVDLLQKNLIHWWNHQNAVHWT